MKDVNKAEIKQQNRKAMPKFIVIMTLSVLIGGAFLLLYFLLRAERICGEADGGGDLFYQPYGPLAAPGPGSGAACRVSAALFSGKAHGDALGRRG